MPSWLLQLLNIAFLVFHTALIAFNAVGWVWKRTRRVHLLTVGLTLASWLLMGLWKGVGYCVSTAWHWQVRRALGIHDPDSTYIQFLVRVLTGWSPPDDLVRDVTGSAFALIVIATVYLNVRDLRATRAATVSSI